MLSKRIAARLGFALVAALIADQAALRLLLADDTFLGRRVAPFDPPIFCDGQARSLARIGQSLASGDPLQAALDFDPLLGWCPRPESGSGGTNSVIAEALAKVLDGAE